MNPIPCIIIRSSLAHYKNLKRENLKLKMKGKIAKYKIKKSCKLHTSNVSYIISTVLTVVYYYNYCTFNTYNVLISLKQLNKSKN